jgi:hypothetical protein
MIKLIKNGAEIDQSMAVGLDQICLGEVGVGLGLGIGGGALQATTPETALQPFQGCPLRPT